MGDNELKFEDEAKKSFRESTKWMKIFGIILFVISIYDILSGLYQLSYIDYSSINFIHEKTISLGLGSEAYFYSTIYKLIIGGIIFLIAYKLTRAARSGKMAVLCNDNKALTNFTKLNNSCWKFACILFLVALSLAFIMYFLIYL